MEALLILEQRAETEISPNKTKLDLEEFSLENLSVRFGLDCSMISVSSLLSHPKTKEIKKKGKYWEAPLAKMRTVLTAREFSDLDP